MNTTIFATIRDEINDFMYNDIEVVDGYSFNQYDTIKRTHLYLNSQFEGSPMFEGREKIFFNIVKFRKEAVARFFDIDTKDIKLRPLNPASEFSTLFLEKELQYWVKKNKFDILLNKLADQFTGYGSAVLRKTNKGAKIMDLRRLFLDPTVESISDSRFIIVKHNLTVSQLRAKTKDGWDADAIERIIRRVEERKTETNATQSYEDGGNINTIRSTPYIEVYERFGEVPMSEFGGKSNKLARSLFIVAEPFMQASSEDGTEYDNGEVLFSAKWNKEYPFRDIHYSKTEGRWLGVGVIEDLFPIQERINEVKNQQRVSMEISSLHLFQTADNTLVSNVLSDLTNGTVLKSKSGINPIVNEERNLAAFGTEEQSYLAMADRISFANDLVTGGQLPTSTPATNAVIQQNNSVSVFLFKRQNVTNWLQDFFTDLVLPQALKDMSAEHILRYVGDSTVLRLIDDAYVQTEKFQAILKSEKAMSEEEFMAVEFEARNELQKLGNARFVKIKENLYGDLEFEFDIQIGNEQEDPNVMANNIKAVLVDLVTNPQLMDNPLAKLLFSEYAQRIGINPAKLEMAMGKMETAKLDPKLLETDVNKLVGEVTERQTAQPDLTAASASVAAI
jgi:hypothetical protein